MTNLPEILGTALSDKNTYVVIGIRHGQKREGSGDVALTDHGCDQAIAMFRYLQMEGFAPVSIAFSGAWRTRQMAQIACSILDVDSETIVCETSFHFSVLVEQHFPGNPRAVLDEAQVVKTAGGTVAKALEMSAYARGAREQVSDGIYSLVRQLRSSGGRRQGLFFSHSPCLECAAVDAENTPYGVGECDAVLWVVKWDSEKDRPELVASHFLKAPMSGDANV